ncbi:MAG: hypothetical protein AB7F91_05995 [Parvularculaceae bacterium]|nr:hypothetical protein [Parvularculaceae bacterium]
MKKLAVTIALSMIAGAAHAGMTQPAEVDVDAAGGFAGGDQVTARYNVDPDVYIGCGMRRFALAGGGFTAFGFCQAEDADGDVAFCNTANADLLGAIESSGDFGYITFSWDVATGECTRIGFSNQSFYLPKKLDRN